MGLPQLVYAGSHGFDITGPNGLEKQHEEGEQLLPILDKAEQHLNERLKNINGVKVERKKYAIAVHYRNVEKSLTQEVKNAVLEELAQHPKLKKGSGKKIIELKPNINWHKGKALIWLIENLEPEGDFLFPIYIGDDITDEDAFEEIANLGIGIIVGTHDQETAATYSLREVAEVIPFLEEFKNYFKKKNGV